MSSRTVFVTGASGIVGSSVATAFSQKGYKVYGLIRSEPHKTLLLLHEIIPVFGDFTKEDVLEKYIAESGIIVECASLTASSTLIEIVTRIAAKTGKCTDTSEEKKKVIWTTGVLQYPFEEKFLASTGVVPIVVRPSFVYGGNGGGVFKELFFREPEATLKIYGKAKKAFPWVHYADLAEAYLLIAQHKAESLRGKLFKVGSFENVPFHDDLFVACARAQGWKGKAERTGDNGTWVGDVEYIPDAPEGSFDKKVDWDIKEFDNSAAVQILGWKESHRNEELIKNMEIYYKAFKVWISTI